MDLSKFFEELLVVIVLHKPRPENSSAYASIQTALNILPVLPEIFLYDNSPQNASLNHLQVTYFHDPRNSGVSKAYNDAAVIAAKQNKKWMLFLDQDTNVDQGLFEKFARAMSAHPESVAFVPGMKDRKGLVSPFYFASGRGRRIKTLPEKLSLKAFRFINSGLLIKHSAFIQAGGYDERIPLDFSDIAFGERLSKITDHFRIINATLDHSFSATAKLPLKEALTRFHYFCRGALIMGKISGRVYLYNIRTFIRASYLVCKYRNFGFIKIFLQHRIHD